MALIQFKHGHKSTIPNGELGEPLFTDDTNEFYIGLGENTPPKKISDIVGINITHKGAISGSDCTEAIDAAIELDDILYLPRGTYIYNGTQNSYIIITGVGNIVTNTGDPHPYFVRDLGTTYLTSNLNSYLGIVNHSYVYDNATRFYVLPKNTVSSGVCTSLKLFFDPYHLGSDYRDMGLWTATNNPLNPVDSGFNGSGIACVNSKVGALSTSAFYTKCPDIVFGFMDGGILGARYISVTKMNDQVPEMTSNSAPSGTVVLSDEKTGNEGYLAFNNSGINFSRTNNTTSGSHAYNAITPFILTTYTVEVNSLSGFANAPKNWILEGYDGESWIELDIRTNIVWTNTSDAKKTFVVSNTEEYSGYRLNFSAVNGGDHYAVVGLEFGTNFAAYSTYINGTIQSENAEGTVSIAANSNIVNGINTYFTLYPRKSKIIINGEENFILSVESDTTLTCEKPFLTSASGEIMAVHMISLGAYEYGTIRAEFFGDILFRNTDRIRWQNNINKPYIQIFPNDDNELNFTSTGTEVDCKLDANGHFTGIKSIIGAYTLGTAGDTTPSVEYANVLVIPVNGSAYDIIRFDYGILGQEITVIFSDNKATVKHNNSYIALLGAVDCAAFAGLTLTLIFDGTKWVEKCRSYFDLSHYTTDNLAEGLTNEYYTDAKARASISSSATGLTYTNTTGVISLTPNYVIPTTTEQTNWTTAYTNNHTHANSANLAAINQNLASTSAPTFTGATLDNIANSSSLILSLKSKTGYSSVVRLYEDTTLRGQLAYRADLNATELRNPQTGGGVVSLPDTGGLTLDGGGTEGQVYISKGNLKIGTTLAGVMKATEGVVSANATTSDLPDSTDKRYCTEAQKTIINNTSGVNTGDETASTIKTKLGTASSSTDGYLTSSDWNTFNSKETALSTTQTAITLTGDISLASYASKSVNLTTHPAGAKSVAFNSDGTKLFVFGDLSPTVNYYTLSTAWDVSTASYSSNHVFSEITNLQGACFNSDGTKIYATSYTDSKIYQYSLSTAWDISTISYDSKYISTSGYATRGIIFNPDGTKLYMTDGTAAKVFQWTLSTAWDISTASYASKYLSVGSQETAPRNSAFNSDGTKLYVIGTANHTVYQYNLSTAYDVSTGSYASKSYTVSEGTNNSGIFISSDMVKMYISDYTNHYVYQYTLMTGSAVFSQPLQKANYKNVIIYLNALSGAASYTFPTAFTYTPQVLSQSLTAKITAVSASAVTVTATGETGFIELNGY